MQNTSLGDFKIHGTATLGPKSQVVVPKEVREILGIKPGDNLVIITKMDKAVTFIKADSLSEFIDFVNKNLVEKK